MSEERPTLRLERVTKRFGDFTAVDGLSLTVRAGRVYGLIGPNGAGKTTTIRMIVGITAPDEGRLELFGRAVTPESQNRIGYLPEERGLYKRMKIADQLRFFAELKNFKGREADEAIDRWLAKVKLAEWKRKKASELSKGMQQKIQFVAAVLHDPDLLILDEPFSGLDPVSSELLIELVLELKAKGKTIIFSTHQMEVAERVCDDICLINRSHKVLDGSLREVKRGFGRNSVALRFEGGGDGVLEDTSLVAGVKRHSDEMEALLAPGADPQEVLRRLLASGARVSKFELVEPSLHDIFIEKVGGDE
ncbi:MAG TPA: ATP-binding cassette domain-containing protein [Pyrinomonadaceae bacterium]|nr:ATP-binding cassette domain-containing protein [Pyrinomonadaceae bacterium]